MTIYDKKDVQRLMAGVAHKDANPNAKKAAASYGLDVSTLRRYSRGQGTPLIRLESYLTSSQHPHRIAAAMLRAADETQIKGMSQTELLDQLEWPATDPSTWAWADLALQWERKVTTAIRQSAILVELAKRRVPVSDALRQRWSSGASRTTP